MQSAVQEPYLEVEIMSLILHMKIPGAIVVASDCRITGTENLYVPVKQEKTSPEGKKVFDLGKPEEINPQKQAVDETIKVPFGHYDFVKTDSEQKTFLLITNEDKPFAISYCGNANLNGYPASYQIKTALSGMTGVNTTSEIADEFNQYWNRKAIDRRPNLLVSGYNAGKPSVLEVKVDGSTIEHFRDEGSFGIIYHGDQAVANALIALGDFEYSLLRLQDAIDFCSTMITTTAKIQSFQKKQQTVSEVYDLLVVTECKAKWIKRSTVELD